MPRFIALCEEDSKDTHSGYTKYVEVLASSRRDAAKKLKQQGESVIDLWDADESKK
jgi:hypothetical protein